MDFQSGLFLGIIGCTVTLVGFTIAYIVANYHYKKEIKKNKPLSSVEQSLKNLRDMPGSKAGDDCQ